MTVTAILKFIALVAFIVLAAKWIDGLIEDKPLTEEELSNHLERERHGELRHHTESRSDCVSGARGAEETNPSRLRIYSGEEGNQAGD